MDSPHWQSGQQGEGVEAEAKGQCPGMKPTKPEGAVLGARQDARPQDVGFSCCVAQSSRALT